MWAGEWLSGKFTHEVIAISKIIQDILKKRCNRVSKLIYNGVFLPEKSRGSDFLKSLGVEPGRYILAVSRIEPEKGLDVLKERYFKCGDVDDLKEKIDYHLDKPVTPYADTVKSSCHSNLKELRIQSRGEPIRVLYAFDPNRRGILLCAGNKTGNEKRFYEVMIPIADREFTAHLEKLKKE